MSPKVAIIAALEREIAAFVRSWRKQRRQDNRHCWLVFQRENNRVVCAGIGAESATAAAEYLIAVERPEVVMSIGFAGALSSSRRTGDIIIPGKVADAASGEVFCTGHSSGVLVTAARVTDEAHKRELATRYAAEAVDMEAASVARVAKRHRIPFAAVKVISDEVDFPLPPMDKFVDDQGAFRYSKLLAWAAVRPKQWPVLAQLGADAAKASAQLCRWLENQMSGDFQDIWIERTQTAEER